jgi:hypothetical protein
MSRTEKYPRSLLLLFYPLIDFTAFTFKNILFGVIVVILTGCSSSRPVSVSSDYYAIPFRSGLTTIPIIAVKLNNKDAWFVVDTGASTTVLNAALSIHFRLSSYSNETEINGLGGASLFQTSLCKIELGPLIINHSALKSKGLNQLFSVIGKNENISVAGILGSDILSKYRINVNYETNTVSFKIKPAYYRTYSTANLGSGRSMFVLGW